MIGMIYEWIKRRNNHDYSSVKPIILVNNTCAMDIDEKNEDTFDIHCNGCSTTLCSMAIGFATCFLILAPFYNGIWLQLYGKYEWFDCSTIVFFCYYFNCLTCI